MTTWQKDAKEFTVSVTGRDVQNRKRRTSYSYIPKPILQMLNNPDALKFTVRDGYIEVGRSNE